MTKLFFHTHSFNPQNLNKINNIKIELLNFLKITNSIG